MASEWEVLETPHSVNPIVPDEPFTLEYRCRLQVGDGAEHEDWIQVYGEDGSLKGEGTTLVPATDGDYEASVDFSIGLDPGNYSVYLHFDRSDSTAEPQIFALAVTDDGQGASSGATGGGSAADLDHVYRIVCYEGCDPQPDREVQQGQPFRITWSATNIGGVKADAVVDAVWVFGEGSEEPVWGGSYTVNDLESGDYYEAEVEVDTPLGSGTWEIVSIIDYHGTADEKRLPLYVAEGD